MAMGQCRHCHAQFAEGAATTAMVASKLLGVGFSFASHTSVNPALLRQKLEHASFVASISEYDRQQLALSGDSGVLEKIHVIHCGIPVEDWPAEPPRPVGAPLRILTVGALNEKKGHDNLIRACALLKRQGIPFECRIVGSGDQEQALAGLIAQLGLDSHVRLLGPLPQATVRKELSRADVFVLAAKTTAEGDTDGIPVSLMEAMAASVPVVSTSVAGIPELVVHGETGLLGPEQDETRLAENIVLAAQDGPKRIARIARARKKIELEFNQAKESQKLATLLLERMNSMAAGAGRPGACRVPVPPP
jgi:glycosyltransferase involved in cell wall biosynthesis